MVICTSGNAIITKDDGRMIKYRHQCRNCGYVDNQEDLCSIPSGRVSQWYSGSCPKCYKPFGKFEFERR